MFRSTLVSALALAFFAPLLRVPSARAQNDAAPTVLAASAEKSEEKGIRILLGLEEELRPDTYKTAVILGNSVVATLSAAIVYTLWGHGTLPSALAAAYVADLNYSNWMTPRYSYFRDRAMVRYRQSVLRACEVHPKFFCTVDPEKSRLITFFRRDTHSVVTRIDIEHDPKVIEVRSLKFAVDELDGDVGEVFDLVLFSITKKERIHTPSLGSEGHLHIDFDSMFRDARSGEYDYRHFRNFIVDWVNHNELYFGALHFDPKSQGARPHFTHWAKGAAERDAFAKWVVDFDRETAAGTMTDDKFHRYRTALKIECGFDKDSALNVEPSTVKWSEAKRGEVPRLLNAGTIEVRALRPKASLLQLKRIARLLQSRVRFQKAFVGLIPYRAAGAIRSAQDGVDRFHRFVTEPGESWEEMKTLLPAAWQRLTPVERDDADLFRPGPTKPPYALRVCTRFMIHVLGK